jgi:hypothetical protein
VIRPEGISVFTAFFLRVAGRARVGTELACEEQTWWEQIFWVAGLWSGLRAASCCTGLPVSVPEFWPGGRAPALQNGGRVQLDLARLEA